MVDFSEQELIAKIQAGGSDIELVMSKLYEDDAMKRSVQALAQRNGGGDADTEDVLHEGIRNVIMNIREGSLSEITSLNGYLMTICKNIWYTQFMRAVHLNQIKK
jgi:DNA-directed RNA polymerase specialized sigma24 family protein